MSATTLRLLVRDFVDACNARSVDDPRHSTAVDDMSESERLAFELKWEQKFREALKDEARKALGVTP